MRLVNCSTRLSACLPIPRSVVLTSRRQPWSQAQFSRQSLWGPLGCKGSFSLSLWLIPSGNLTLHCWKQQCKTEHRRKPLSKLGPTFYPGIQHRTPSWTLFSQWNSYRFYSFYCTRLWDAFILMDGKKEILQCMNAITSVCDGILLHLQENFKSCTLKGNYKFILKELLDL